MIDDIRLGWAALRESRAPARGDLMVREVGPPLAHGTALLGLDDRGLMHLLLPAERDGPEEEALEAVRVRRRSLEVAGVARPYVDVVCELRAVEEVFDHFAAATLEAVAHRPEEHPAAVALDILDAWRRFLVPAGRAVTAERLAPLFAELLVLERIAALGPVNVAIWRGPGARHDFVRANVALEVKSTRAHTSREVTIHGVDQMEAPEGAELFLEFVRLEETPDGGRCVPDLVDSLLQSGVGTSALYAAVERGGLPAADFNEARAVRFTVRERIVLPVREPFPRVVPASFVGSEVPTGIRDIVYRADLDIAIDLRLTPEGAEGVHRRLVGGPR